MSSARRVPRDRAPRDSRAPRERTSAAPRASRVRPADASDASRAPRNRVRREAATRARVVLGGVLAAALVVGGVLVGTLPAGGFRTGFANAGTSARSAAAHVVPPNLSVVLGGFAQFWTASGRGDLHGDVHDPAVLQHNDELVVWINRHATSAERFVALQDSEYLAADSDARTYDQSITISTGLGSVLGPAYVRGRISGALPLTTALLNTSTGTSGAFASTGTPKGFFSYPRPFLPVSATAPAHPGDVIGCSPAVANASSLAAIRLGRPYADAAGDLEVRRVPAVVDTTHAFAPDDVPLDAAYGTTGICGGGSFPSGHTTSAYQVGITLATLLPELGPEILARASENGNSRIVLGVHYPLDVIGGRMDGEAAIAAQWSDARYRTEVLEPARAELLAYLATVTGHDLGWNIAHQTAYHSDPYGGAAMPGGSSQVVTDRATAVAVFGERMTYGFAASGRTGRAPSVPAGAANLLRTAFPQLTDAQRTSILAQTEGDSGFPLDATGTAGGSWQRLDLAAALSATVRLEADGTVTVTATGGPAQVIAGG